MQGSRRRFPWITASVVALAALAWAAPATARAALDYDRDSILRGEAWRLWSGHLVHFSASHLGWNLLVAGGAGVWIESARFPNAAWLPVLAPPFISLSLLAGEPSLLHYGGLSGVATAAVVFACVSEWRGNRGWRVLWGGALLAIVLKIAWEYGTGVSLFAHYAGAQVRNVPLSHLAGFCAGAAIGLARRRSVSP